MHRLTVLALAALSVSAFAAEPAERRLPAGAKVFIGAESPTMDRVYAESEFTYFVHHLRAAALEKRLPLTIVNQREQADYLLISDEHGYTVDEGYSINSSYGRRSSSTRVSPQTSRQLEARLKLFDVKTRETIWLATEQDNSRKQKRIADKLISSLGKWLAGK